MNPSRKFIDFLVSWMGMVAVVGLLIGGGLALWANSYTNDQVHSQMASQQIFFPKPARWPQLASEAGQQVLTGQQAKDYADIQILGDMNAMSGGQTYAQLSSKSRADPTNTKLADLVATVFKGTTLRGLLLNAYAFGTIATIAGWSALVAFVGAGLLLILSILGFLHAAGKLRLPSEKA